jgi:hypothetical protein
MNAIESIHDFDENKSIIAYCVNHKSLGVNGRIFCTTDYDGKNRALAAAKSFLFSLRLKEIGG